jgi:hypothetical protein
MDGQVFYDDFRQAGSNGLARVLRFKTAQLSISVSRSAEENAMTISASAPSRARA